jgi:hypothetical protein
MTATRVARPPQSGCFVMRRTNLLLASVCIGRVLALANAWRRMGTRKHTQSVRTS